MPNRHYNKQVAQPRTGGGPVKTNTTRSGSGANGVGSYDRSGNSGHPVQGGKGSQVKASFSKTGHKGKTFADAFRRKESL